MPTYSWQNIPTHVSDQPMGYQTINKVRNNALATRERFETEHKWSNGAHDWDAIGMLPARAFCTFDDTPTLESNSFNVTGVAAGGGTGDYVVTFTNAIGHTLYTVLCAYIDNALAAAWTSGPIVRVKSRSSTTVTLSLTDGVTGQDLTSGELISVVVFAW